jgi:hypothetical protein
MNIVDWLRHEADDWEPDDPCKRSPTAQRLRAAASEIEMWRIVVVSAVVSAATAIVYNLILN